MGEWKQATEVPAAVEEDRDCTRGSQTSYKVHYGPDERRHREWEAAVSQMRKAALPRLDLPLLPPKDMPGNTSPQGSPVFNVRSPRARHLFTLNPAEAAKAAERRSPS